MDEKLREEVQAAVTAIFSEKEEANMRKKTEDALQKSAETIQDLTASQEAKNEELTLKNEKISEMEEKAQSLDAELEAVKQEVESVNEKLVESEKALEEMKKDRAAEKRIVELSEAKVSDSDEASQLEKVREMSDEEFESYKNERISLREAVIAEIKTLKDKEETITETEEETAEEETAEEENEETSEEEIDTLPANIDPGQVVSAALNMEVIPSKDVMKKYAELGRAMADNMTKQK